ncbi:transcription antiterminator, partial [human gut metagenome]
RQGQLVPIERSKEELFREMVNDNYEIAMSCGLIEGDKVTITDGPLAGKEAMICKINRHKRTATLNVEMFGDKAGVTVGLEVVENWTITIIEKFSEEDKIQYNFQQKFIMNHINSVQSVCVPYEQL